MLDEDVMKLLGEVEVDETYVGGKRRGKRGRGAEGKIIVVGTAQRNGKVIAKVVPDVKRSTLVPFVARKVSSEDTILYTDEFPSYDHMARLRVILKDRAPANLHPKRVASHYLLSGLAKCGYCGKALVGQDAKGG